MTIATKTPAQALAARDAVYKVAVNLQQFAQGTEAPASASAAYVTATNTLITEAKAALEALVPTV